ncbi:hypothetical protein IKF92_01435 [Candidatus Saccharibacteria bacterium]|nr:hypothetical protein [Candidatus Saccharibacteria bacterium]
MKKRVSLTYVLIGFLSVVISCLFVSTTMALDQEKLEQYSENSIFFFEPCASSSSVLGGDITIAGDTAEEKVWSGLISFLTDEQAAGIMGNIGQEDGNYNPVRREVGQGGSLYDKSAQMGLGFIQWSFGRRVNLLNYIKEQDSSLLQYFEDDSNAQITGDQFIEKVGDETANRIFQLELEFLKSEMDKSYTEYYKKTDIDDATVWFRARVERAGVYSDNFRKEKAHAAYDKYAGKGMEQLGSPSCNGNASGNKNINATAVSLAWPYKTPESDYKWGSGKATEAFDKAINKVYPSRGSWNQYSRAGASCDVFVGTVVRYSGYDKNFPRSLGKDLDYVEKNEDLWEKIKFNGKESEVQSGDILYRSTHIAIAVRDDNNKLYIAEAAYKKKFGHIKSFSDNYEYIFRAKRGNNTTSGVSVEDGVSKYVSAGTIAKAGSGNGDIGASALELAWPYGTDSSVYEKRATDKFTNYYNTLPKITQSNGVKGGRSCDRFVHTVVMYSGLDDDIPIGDAPHIQEYLAGSDKWEEVEMANPKSTEEYESGDVIAFGNGGISHVGIYVEDGGKGYIAQASYGGGDYPPYYGVVKDTSNITSNYFSTVKAYRNKNNQSGATECDVCGGEGEDDGSLMGLKEGGLSLAEANSFMKKYHDAAMGKYYKKHPGDTVILGGLIHDTNCPFGIMNNCVAFSQWFINAYTTAGEWRSTTNGVGVARKLGTDLGLKTGNKPRPYAIFSHAGPSSAGHTGVILGVDEKRKKVVVGEASCSMGQNSVYYAPHAVEKSFGEIGSWNYAYTDEVIKTDAFK